MSIIIFFVKNYKIILSLLAFSFVFVITYRITRTTREARKGFKEIFTLDGFIIFIVVFIICLLIFAFTKTLF